MESAKPSRATEWSAPLVGALFFLSGATSLTYQLVWVRMLVLTFGSTTLAVSTVLTSFMAGLALGSVYAGRWVDRRGRGLEVYAGLELMIGVTALLLIPLLGLTDDLYSAAHGMLQEHRNLLALYRFVLSFVVLLVPSTLIGGTLPALSKFVTRRLPAVGRAVGTLYAINTLGAAAGCVIVAFLLLEGLGIRNTIFVTAGVNVCIAILAYAISVGTRARTPLPAGEDSRPTVETHSLPAPPIRALRAVFWGYALSGFAALGYEVVWTRLLAVVLRSTTTQSLSTILIVFLTGLAVGGAVASRFVDRFRNLLAAFGVTELLLGLSALGSVAVFGAIPSLVQRLGPVYTWWGHLGRHVAVACAAMLIPTFLMGMLFPIAGRIQVRSLETVGRKIGGIYAINTTGSIFGAFVVGFALMPLVGTQWSIQLLAWINIAVGATVLLLDSSLRARTRSVAIASAVVPALVLTLVFPSSYLIGLFRPQGASALLYYDESASGTVTVLEYESGDRLLRVNGAGEVPTDRGSIQTFRLLGSLPLLIHPDPEEVLVIAFGGGVTLASVELQRPRHIDCVEIVPGVIGAAPYFAEYNNHVYDRLDDGHIDIIADDGRSYVLRTPKSYDVIVSDSTHPATADSWLLYTKDFYELCKKKLREGGIFAQWVPLHGLTPDDYRMIVRTFRSAFGHTSVWLTADYSVFVGTTDPLRIEFERLRSRFESPEVKASLTEVDLGDPVSLLSTLALDEQAAEVYADDGPINTDDRAYINFRDRLRSEAGSGTPVLYSLISHLAFRPDRFMRGTSEELRAVDRRRRSRKHLLTGVVAQRIGDRARALRELELSRHFDRTNREAERLLEAMQSSTTGQAGAGS